MKKFKHKKTGYIASEKKPMFQEERVYLFEGGDKFFTFPKFIIEESSDWEEILDRDYEILSKVFTLPDIDSIKEGTYVNITNNEGEIHSIKRLSDGEVFSVGDKVALKEDWNDCFIKSFKIDKQGNLLFLIKDNGAEGYYNRLKDFFKVEEKPVLFTTEDGVEVREGDEYSFINKYWDCYTVEANATSGKNNLNKRFSTREAAEQYIEENKPKYSLKEIKDSIENILDEDIKRYILKNLNK